MPDPAMPGQPDDLAGAGLEAHVDQAGADGQAADDERRPAVVDTAGSLGEEVLLLRADHRLDHFGNRQRGGVAGQDLPAVAHHRHSIGDLEDLLEAMRHVQHRDSLACQLAQDGEQSLCLAVIERRVRLVENQHLGVLQQHPGELDQLSLGDRYGADRHVEFDVESQPGEHRAGESLHFPGRDESEAGRLSVDEQVGEQRAIGEDAEFLVDDPDAVVARRPRRRQLDRLTVDRDRAGVRADRPGEGLHQRRLAGPVLTDDRMDRSRGDVEVHRLDGDDAPVGLAQPVDLDLDHLVRERSLIDLGNVRVSA